MTVQELRRWVDPLRVRALRWVADVPPPYRIADVPWPEGSDSRHTLLSGAAGTGKTALISDLVDLSPRTLERYRATGEGPRFHKLGGRVRYTREDIERWLNSCVRRSTSDDGGDSGGCGQTA